MLVTEQKLHTVNMYRGRGALQNTRGVIKNTVGWVVGGGQYKIRGEGEKNKKEQKKRHNCIIGGRESIQKSY